MKRFILSVLYFLVGVSGEVKLTRWWLKTFDGMPFWRM